MLYLQVMVNYVIAATSGILSSNTCLKGHTESKSYVLMDQLFVIDKLLEWTRIAGCSVLCIPGTQLHKVRKVDKLVIYTDWNSQNISS